MFLKSENYIAVPPGATIKEQLDDRGLTQKEFALRMELSEKHISKLINGQVALTKMCWLHNFSFGIIGLTILMDFLQQPCHIIRQSPHRLQPFGI